MRTIVLRRVAVALLIICGLTATGTTYARGNAVGRVPMCEGHPATVVGHPGQRFVGTSHRDVIVTNGGFGTARGGNDLMCVTGHARRMATVLTGPGADVVDAQAVPAGHRDSVVLGPGADSFRGGPASDFVYAGSGDNVVHTAGGHDFVDTGSFSRQTPNHSRIHVGPGPDIVAVEGRAAGVVVDGGTGSNRLFPFDFCCRSSRIVLDLPREVMTRDGRVVMHVRGFNRFVVPLPARHFTFVGTAASEHLGFNSAYLCCRRPPKAPVLVRIHMGAGNDRVDSTYELRGRVSGGPGNDLLTTLVRATAHVGINLSHALAEDGQRVLRLAGLERSDWRLAGSVPTVQVTGTPHADQVELSHTRFGPARGLVTMDGLGGDDRLTVRIQPAILRGGPGDDVLRGGAGDDLIIGGGGRDRADGQGGKDSCDAETEIRCELPVG